MDKSDRRRTCRCTGIQSLRHRNMPCGKLQRKLPHNGSNGFTFGISRVSPGSMSYPFRKYNYAQTFQGDRMPRKKFSLLQGACKNCSMVVFVEHTPLRFSYCNALHELYHAPDRVI